MASYVPTFTAIYEKPEDRPPEATYGKNIAFLGLSETGAFNNPTYVSSTARARAIFGSGPLVDAFEEAFEAGARNIFLIRLEELSVDKIVDVFEILLDAEIHILAPLGIYFDDATNWAGLFVDFMSIRKDYCECVTVMASTPFVSGEVTDTMVKDRVTELYQNQKARTGFEEGYFLSIIASEGILFSGSENERTTDCVPTYAALLSRVKPGHSPVNKKIASNLKLRYQFSRGSRSQALTLSPTPIIFERRPLDDTVKVTSPDGQTIYADGADYKIDYVLGTIVRSDSGTLGDVVVTYKFDDNDSLASVGFVSTTEFVKNGSGFAAGVTMSKNTISLIQDIRVMQAISSHIREAGLERLIGNTNIVLENFKNYLNSYFRYLQDTRQVFGVDFDISRANGGSDIIIDIEVQPRSAVMAQSFFIRLPLPT